MSEQVFGPDRPRAAIAAIAELRRAEAAMPAWPMGESYDRALERLRMARVAREAYWGYGDTFRGH